MNVLTGHDEAVAEWVGRQVGKPFHPPYTAIGLIGADGTLRGGFVFNGYTGSTIEISLAGAACMRRSSWAAVLDYVFRQLGCVRLQFHTSKRNKRVKRQTARAGFRYEGVARRMYGRDDGVAYSLVVDDLEQFRARWRL